MDEDPSEEDLQKITDWNVLKDGTEGLISLVEDLWRWPEWGFKLSGKIVKTLHLHTGGWSGNELIVRHLKQNILFWSCFWRVHKAGGHYSFKIRKLK